MPDKRIVGKYLIKDEDLGTFYCAILGWGNKHIKIEFDYISSLGEAEGIDSI